MSSALCVYGVPAKFTIQRKPILFLINIYRTLLAATQGLINFNSSNASLARLHFISHLANLRMPIPHCTYKWRIPLSKKMSSDHKLVHVQATALAAPN